MIPLSPLVMQALYECVKAMTGHSHTDKEATPFALQVMQHMNDKCTEWKEAEDIDYSLYGTPLESTTYKFAKALQRRLVLSQASPIRATSPTATTSTCRRD